MTMMLEIKERFDAEVRRHKATVERLQVMARMAGEIGEGDDPLPPLSDLKPVEEQVADFLDTLRGPNGADHGADPKALEGPPGDKAASKILDTPAEPPTEPSPPPFAKRLQDAVDVLWNGREHPLPTVEVPDFREHEGTTLQSFAMVTSREVLPADLAEAALEIVGKLEDCEAMLWKANPTADRRLVLKGSEGPRILYKDPAEARREKPKNSAEIKVAWQLAMRVPAAPTSKPERREQPDDSGGWLGEALGKPKPKPPSVLPPRRSGIERRPNLTALKRREKVIEFVNANEGCKVMEVWKGLELDPPVSEGTIRNDLDRACRDRKILSDIVGRGRGATKVYKSLRSALVDHGGPKTELEERVVEAIAERPITCAGLAIKLKMGREQLGSILGALVRREVLACTASAAPDTPLLYSLGAKHGRGEAKP